MTTLDELLGRLAREGELYERLPEQRVRCYACGNRCVTPPGQRGICKVRWNEDGRLLVYSRASSSIRGDSDASARGVSSSRSRLLPRLRDDVPIWYARRTAPAAPEEVDAEALRSFNRSAAAE